MPHATNRTCARCGRRERIPRSQEGKRKRCECMEPIWREPGPPRMTKKRRAVMERQFALFGVLVPEFMFEKIESSRGELSRDEWCMAAFEAYLARTDVVAKYAKLLKGNRHRRAQAARQRML